MVRISRKPFYLRVNPIKAQIPGIRKEVNEGTELALDLGDLFRATKAKEGFRRLLVSLALHVD